MIEIIFLIIGFIFLIKGADFLIDGASFIANEFKIPQMIIGLTIVSFGTSAPELAVNIMSILNNNTEIIIGNIIGSNMSNLLLVLGITSIISPILLKKNLKKDVLINLAIILILILLSTGFIFLKSTFFLSRIDGFILLSFFILFIIFLFKNSKHYEMDEIKTYLGNKKAIIFILIGFVFLPLGGHIVIENSIKIAKIIGISDFFIGLSVIAIGTSLPELITSVISCIKKNQGIALGNILGSNIQNILLVLSISSIIKEIPLDITHIIHMFILFFCTLLFFIFLKIKNVFGKNEGILFLMIYFIYIFYSMLS